MDRTRSLELVLSRPAAFTQTNRRVIPYTDESGLRRYRIVPLHVRTRIDTSVRSWPLLLIAFLIGLLIGATR